MLSGEATEALAAAKPDGAEVAQRAMKDEAFRNRMRLKIEDQESLASRMAQRGWTARGSASWPWRATERLEKPKELQHLQVKCLKCQSFGRSSR